MLGTGGVATTLGPFELIRKLGAGATAEVFLSTGPNARNEELIALKVMLPHLAEDEVTRRAFLHEGRTSALLRHPNIVEVFDVGEVEGRAYLTMELVHGWSVSALMKKMRAAKAWLPLDEACEIVGQAALGLHFAHEIRRPDGRPMGLVHRDVSPQNLIVSDQGAVKVVDFGLAKATAAQSTVTRSIKGKMKYMPPEQLKGEPLDRRTDVFALGAVLWELVTGQPLYSGSTEAEIFQQALINPPPHPDDVAPGLPREVVEVLLRAVERDPARRIPTAMALAQLLVPMVHRGQSGRALGARLASHFEPLPRTLDELSGKVPIAGPPTRRRSGLPAPPGRLKPPDPDTKDTIASLPPVLSDTANESRPSLPPTDTLADEGGDNSITLGTPGPKSPRRSWLIPALVGGGLAAVVIGVIVVSRSIKDDNEPKYSFEDSATPGTGRTAEGLPGTVIIDANVPAVITRGGKELGTTPAKLSLPPGKYKLKVATPDGALSTEVEVVVVAGGSSKRTVQLK